MGTQQFSRRMTDQCATSRFMHEYTYNNKE